MGRVELLQGFVHGVSHLQMHERVQFNGDSPLADWGLP